MAVVVLTTPLDLFTGRRVVGGLVVDVLVVGCPVVGRSVTITVDRVASQMGLKEPFVEEGLT